VSEHDVPDWAAVGEAMVKRRDALNKMTQEELHVAARVSISAISELENGVIRNRAPGTLARLSKALRWPANHLDDILDKRTAPERATPEQADDDLTSEEKALRSIEGKLDNLNGKLDALLKHYDIVWQPGPPSGISVELTGPDHSHEPPKTEDDGPSSIGG
jgi:transcriptional regulator with XRE-family HTH domain